MPEQFEKAPPLDPKILGEIRDAFAEAVDKRKKISSSTFMNGLAERIIIGEKVPDNGNLDAMLTKIGQDFGLNHEQIDALRDQFFKT